MVYKKTLGGRLFDIFNTLFLISMVLLCVYPFWYVITCSLSNSDLLMGDRGLMLWPKGFSLSAYKAVLQNPNIYTGYRTTLIVVVGGSILNVILTAMGAFLVTRKNFALSKPMMTMMLITMYFGGGMIPTYLLVSQTLGLRDSIWALILPGAISVYNLIVMKTNFQSIPESLEESAKLYGANDMIILFKIILPLSIPIIAVMVLFYGVGHWNAWFGALLYIDERSKFPLQLVLREILLLNSTQEMTMGEQGGDKAAIAESIRYATILVATVPILLVYPMIQKYFVSGVMVGAVKG
ncbi:MAG: carbohydrate ABC transporter permease [Clostridia bacterium]|nr:carbohydrate ABC transporter permease [Clostridia bacterium]